MIQWFTDSQLTHLHPHWPNVFPVTSRIHFMMSCRNSRHGAVASKGFSHTHRHNVHAWPPYKIIFLSIPSSSAAVPNKLLTEMPVPSQPAASRPYACSRHPILQLMSTNQAFCISPFLTVSSSGFKVSGTASSRRQTGEMWSDGRQFIILLLYPPVSLHSKAPHVWLTSYCK